MPDARGPYQVIYADPPWRYATGTTTPSRKIENHYQTMSLADICKMKFNADKDSVLLLWATSPLLPEAMNVMNSWGFRYKTSAVWDKTIIGLGHWFRGQHEFLLVGVRGAFRPPSKEYRRSSVFRIRRGKHSRKPDEVRQFIESAWPEANKLEMFAREAWPGWDVLGNEVRPANNLRQKRLYDSQHS